MLPSQYTSAGSHRIKALCGPQVDDSWVGNLCKSPVQFEKAPGKAVEAKCNLQWLQTDIFMHQNFQVPSICTLIYISTESVKTL